MKRKNVLLLLILTLMTIKMQAQSNLSQQQQGLAKISSLTATGDTERLKVQLDSALDAGLSINEIKEALVQLYAYCGFPRSLNAINTFMKVLDVRKAKGITDPEGKNIEVQNNTPDKYEQGRAVLETLTHSVQAKPAPGFGEFAPRIDAFLKEHLFADVFASDVLSYQQRELVTIAALASVTGTEAQLKSHIGIGKNTGISDAQLEELATIIAQTAGETQANTIRKIQEIPLLAVAGSGMIIRIAEIELVPGMLEAYKVFLKDNAAVSVKTEPGVLAIFPMYQQQDSLQIRIIEIYADSVAYEAHLQTSHFQHYKTSTLQMVKSLKLVEMDAIDKEMMSLIFDKIK